MLKFYYDFISYLRFLNCMTHFIYMILSYDKRSLERKAKCKSVNILNTNVYITNYISLRYSCEWRCYVYISSVIRASSMYYYMPCVYIRYWSSKFFLSAIERSALGMRDAERIRYNNELDYRVIDADPAIQKAREELWLTLSDNENV